MKRYDYIRDVADVAYEYMNENDYTIDKLDWNRTVDDVCFCIENDAIINMLGDKETKEAVMDNLGFLDFSAQVVRDSLVYGVWHKLDEMIRRAVLHDAVAIALHRYMEEVDE